MIENVGSPLAIAVHNNLSVTVGSEMISQLLKLQSYFFEIVNFTIKNHPDGFVGVGHWLMATRQIDDRQATKSEANWTGNEETFVVRPPMSNRVSHVYDRGLIHRLIAGEIKLTTAPTHTA